MQYFVTVLVVLTISYGASSTPVPSYKNSRNHEPEKIVYDQSQEGEWNVRADLKNFVFVIIPTSGQQNDIATTAASSGTGLLDLLLSKANHGNNKNHVRRIRPHKNQERHQSSGETSRETAQSFLEAKTAPYHVDISQTRSHLLNDEILATQKPPQALKITPELTKILEKARTGRRTEAFVLTVPEEDFVITKMEDSNKIVKKDDHHKVKKAVLTKKPQKEDESKLLGAMEGCGPGLFRDMNGICQIDK